MQISTTDSQVEIIGESNSTDKTNLNQFIYFPTAIYTMEKPEFLADVRSVAMTSLNKRKKEVQLDKIYPMYMSDSLLDDAKMKKFLDFVAHTGWEILEQQGYNMSIFKVFFTEAWCQEHHTHSSMDQHVHNGGNQLVGFYFLDTPPDTSKILFHDPRPGKVQINLPETNHSNATLASDIINFDPKPGLLIFSNAWLPHSYTKNGSNKPLRFIHFNLSVQHDPTANFAPASPAEVI